MPYNQNIPQSFTIPSQDQPIILANFVEIATALSVDHGSFNAVTEGQHNKISFTGTGAVPATNFGIYATGAAMLLRNNGINFDITTLTNSIVNGSAGQGSVTLPCGLILKFGRTQGSNVGTTTIIFTSAFSAGGQCTALVSVMDPNFPQLFHASVESLSATQLKVKTTNYAGTAYQNAYFYWLAIGH
jgi:hypothetical protein